MRDHSYRHIFDIKNKEKNPVAVHFNSQNHDYSRPFPNVWQRREKNLETLMADSYYEGIVRVM